MTVIQFPIKKQQSKLTETIMCPYHKGLSPSCFVNHLLNSFLCMDCRESGSVATLREKLAESKPSSE